MANNNMLRSANNALDFGDNRNEERRAPPPIHSTLKELFDREIMKKENDNQ